MGWSGPFCSRGFWLRDRQSGPLFGAGLVTLPFLNLAIMSRKAKFYLIFFALMVVGFYVALTQVIPGFGKVKLPVLNYVKQFSFINQDGKRVTNQDVAGKVYVAEYFFTTCKSICPVMNTNMRDIY